MDFDGVRYSVDENGEIMLPKGREGSLNINTKISKIRAEWTNPNQPIRVRFTPLKIARFVPPSTIQTCVVCKMATSNFLTLECWKTLMCQ